MIAADVFVDGFAHLQAGERPIELLKSGPVRLARWSSDGRRGGGFTEEFFPVDLDAATVLRHVRAVAPGPRHYVTMIGGEVDDPAGFLAAAGYAVNSREALMTAGLNVSPSDDTAHAVTTVTDADAERSHALQFAQTGHVRIITPAQLADPAVIVLQVRVDGEPACTGKVVLLEDHAYVSDIATLLAYRRRGLARSLMLGLHAAARHAGAETAVLTSSAMGRGFYLALDYVVLREIVIWEPSEVASTA